MRPSRSETSARRAPPIAASWVTITTVLPSACDRASSARISLAGLRVEIAGRLVGEHERGAVHERARDRDALALAARELGRADARARAAEADARERRERALAPLARAARRGRRAAAPRSRRAESRGSRLKLWNTKPISLAAQRARGRRRRSSSTARARRAGSCPRLGRERQPRISISVVLPEPDGPMIATSSPRLDAQVDAAQRVHLELARSRRACARPRARSRGAGAGTAALIAAHLVALGEARAAPARASSSTMPICDVALARAPRSSPRTVST